MSHYRTKNSDWQGAPSLINPCPLVKTRWQVCVSNAREVGE